MDNKLSKQEKVYVGKEHPLFITKAQAIKHLGRIKKLLHIAEEYWNETDIPKHYASFSSINGAFWFYVTDYWIWNDSDFVQFTKDAQEAANSFGFRIIFAQVHPVAKAEEKRNCISNKDMFIEP